MALSTAKFSTTTTLSATFTRFSLNHTISSSSSTKFPKTPSTTTNSFSHSIFTIRASSVDIEHRLSYNPQRTYPPNKPDVIATSSNKPQPKLSVSDLLKRDIPKTEQAELVGTYLGYETWLPNAPKVDKPRSTFNPASLAYIGDCIYELYARKHFLLPPLNIEEYNGRVMAVVRCEAQDAMLQKLMADNFLSQEERDVLRWGKNIGSSKTKTKKRAGVAVYNRASSLETLVGYLYLTNTERLNRVMEKLGFSTEATPLPENGNVI